MFVPPINAEIENIIHVIENDREFGLIKLTELANSGNESAIESLGLYLSEDAETYDEAMKWLILAAGFGSADAAWNIAMISRQYGDMNLMKKWIDRSADLGGDDASEVRKINYDIDQFLS